MYSKLTTIDPSIDLPSNIGHLANLVNMLCKLDQNLETCIKGFSDIINYCLTNHEQGLDQSCIKYVYREICEIYTLNSHIIHNIGDLRKTLADNSLDS